MAQKSMLTFTFQLSSNQMNDWHLHMSVLKNARHTLLCIDTYTWCFLFILRLWYSAPFFSVKRGHLESLYIHLIVQVFIIIECTIIIMLNPVIYMFNINSTPVSRSVAHHWKTLTQHEHKAIQIRKRPWEDFILKWYYTKF